MILTKPKYLLIIIAFLGLTAVVLGAFGAHLLKDNLSANSFSAYTTAVSYQFTHVMAALFVWIMYRNNNSKFLYRSIIFFLLGILFFCGSLYLLSTKELTGISTSILGPITPIGGVFFIVAWIYIIFAVIKDE